MGQLTLEGNDVDMGQNIPISSLASGVGIGLGSALAFPVLGTAVQPIENIVKQAINYKHPSRFMDVNSAIKLWLRKQLDDVGMIFYLKIEGFLDSEIIRIMESLKPLVPPSDMIRMVVKEAFTPELVKDLIGDEKTPERFTKEIAKWGYSEQVATDYWTAHYDPLGKGEFEEMLHRLHPDQLAVELQRGEITQAEATELQFDEKFLDRMYKLKDVYPALRPRLRHISYKTPTRIDIRRFEDFGIIDDDILTYFNRALGYAPWVAELMTLYTKIANALQDIKPFVQKGIWGEKEVKEALLKKGAPVETAVKLTTRMMRFSKAERVEKNRDLTLGYYQRSFKIGFRTRAELEPMILGLNYDIDETKFILDLWEAEIKLDTAETKAKDLKLTRSVIEKRYTLENGANRATRKKELVLIGYDETEADFLLTNIDLSLSKKKTTVRK